MNRVHTKKAVLEGCSLYPGARDTKHLAADNFSVPPAVHLQAQDQ